MTAKEAQKVLAMMKRQRAKTLYGDGKGFYFLTRNTAMLSAKEADDIDEHRESDLLSVLANARPESPVERETVQNTVEEETNTATGERTAEEETDETEETDSDITEENESEDDEDFDGFEETE